MKKNFLKILSVLLLMFLFVGNIYADKITDSDQTLVQEGEYNSVRLVAANNL